MNQASNNAIHVLISGCSSGRQGDAENARNENTRHENAAPKIRGENGKSET